MIIVPFSMSKMPSILGHQQDTSHGWDPTSTGPPKLQLLPDALLQPLLSTLIGDWADAKSAYQKALVERPRSGFPLYGIAMCSEKAGDSVAAAKEYAEFLAAWKNADPVLTEVIHAQTYVAEHPAVAGGFSVGRMAGEESYDLVRTRKTSAERCTPNSAALR